MDERYSDRLLEPLRHPPLRQRGFDDRLKERIMRELEAGRAADAARRRFTPVAMLLAGMAVVFAFLWMQPSAPPLAERGHEETAAAGDAAPAESEPAADHEFADGLLIGLRSDVPPQERTGGRYRTLWIAPDVDGLRLAAAVDGIVVPYRLDFWLVDETAGETPRLAAEKLPYGDAPPGRTETSGGVPGGAERKAAPAGETGEVLEFAGQSYVVLTRMSGSGRETLLTSLSSLASGERRRIPPDEIAPLPEGEAERAGNGWSVSRREGRWTVVTPGADAPVNTRASVHDGLCVPWTAVLEAEPDAVDAFCSPGGNWMAVLTDDALVALPVLGDGTPGRRALEVPLDGWTKPVMAEWATNGYVAKWTAFLAGRFGRADGEPGL